MCLSVWQVLCCVCVPVFTGLQVLGVCALVCVPVVRPAALCLWCAVSACVVLWVSAGAALWSVLMRCAVVLGCAFINKNKGLQCF